MAYRKQAEEGNRLFQSILGKWFLEQGHAAEALKWLMPLSDSGFKVEQAIAEAWELLARTDPQHEAEAEHWLRALGSGGMLRLAREMRSWPSGREAAAKELLVALAREGNGPAADELARWERSDPVAAIGWHCRAIDLGFTRNWHDLEEVLRALRPVTADDQSLAARARVALDTAQAVERAEAASPPRETQDCLRVAETMAVVVATTAVVPFVQNIASQAAGDVYAKAKQLFGRALRRSSQELTDRSTGPTIYVVGDSMANTWLELRGQPSDDALRKLGEADLETLAAPDPRGRTVTVRWDHGEWRRQVE